MEIFTYGEGARQKRCEELLARRDSRYKRLILLPIPTTKDKKYVFGTQTPLSEVAERCGKGTLAVGYGLPDGFVLECESRGAVVLDAGRDEEFLMKNAELTALAALGWLLTSFPRTLADMRIGIIGYGRIGRRLCELILTLSGRVVVYTRSENTRVSLGEVGVESRLFSRKNDFSGIDILINTAPTRIISDGEAESLPRGLIIAELASGVNFPEGMNVVRLPSLPERFYPETAGALYADFIERRL